MSTILLHRGGKTTTPFADAPDMWPPNSPDLNPVDFAVWGALQQMVYHQQRFDSVDELKRANCQGVGQAQPGVSRHVMNYYRSLFEAI